MRRFWGRLVVSVVVGGAAFAALSHQKGQALSADTSAAPAIPVSATPASRRDLPVYLTGIGAVQAYNTVSVHPQVDGQLVKVTFSEGQDVKTGDVLAQIDPRTYQAALDQANAKRTQDEALLDNARLDVTRYAGLVEKNYISRQQLDATRALVAQYEAAVKGDEAAIHSAEIQLGFTTVRSPIDGRVGIRQIDMGNILHADSPSGGSSETLVVVTQLHPIAVVFTLNQDDLPRLLQIKSKGKPEVVVFGRDGGAVLGQGRLEVVDNQIDQTTSTVKLKAVFPNTNGGLWPGQFVNARVLVDNRNAVVSVPATALQRGDSGEFVYVVKNDGSVDRRPVVAGAIYNDVAEIVQGIADGEVVVTSGQYRLKAGAKVAVTLTKTANLEPTTKPE